MQGQEVKLFKRVSWASPNLMSSKCDGADQLANHRWTECSHRIVLCLTCETNGNVACHLQEWFRHNTQIRYAKHPKKVDALIIRMWCYLDRLSSELLQYSSAKSLKLRKVQALNCAQYWFNLETSLLRCLNIGPIERFNPT